MPLLPEDVGSHAGGSKAWGIEPDHGDVGVDKARVWQTKSHRHKPVPLLVALVISVGSPRQTRIRRCAICPVLRVRGDRTPAAADQP